MRKSNIVIDFESDRDDGQCITKVLNVDSGVITEYSYPRGTFPQLDLENEMSNIRFAHIRPDNSTRSGALTIAFRDGPVPNTVEFAVSRCSTKDAFCKATGRAYAEGRLRQRLGHTMAISRDASYSSVVEAIKQSDPVRLITRSRSARKLVGHAA